MNSKINKLGKKSLLSILWIIFLLNILYADVLTVMFEMQTLVSEVGSGVANSLLTEEMLFGAAILLETAIFMVVLCHLVKQNINRWLNIVLAVIHALVVFGSLFVASPTSFYLLFAITELFVLLAIIVLAWRWKPEQVQEIATQ